MNPIAVAKVAGQVVALAVDVQKAADKRVQSVTLFKILPLYNREWPFVQRIAARVHARRKRRAERKRDAP